MRKQGAYIVTFKGGSKGVHSWAFCKRWTFSTTTALTEEELDFKLIEWIEAL